MVVASASWWVQTPSVDPTDPAVLAAQAITRPLIGYLLVGSVLVQAIRLIISRRAEPLLTLAAGLLRFAVVSALGLTVLRGALLAGDALSAHLLDGAANNFAFAMRDALIRDQDRLFLALLFSVVALVLAMIQWVLMAFREAGLLVLAAMLPLAAAGPRAWLNRLLAWLLAIVVYKPGAAFIYYIGFSYLSTTSSNDPGGIGTMITGIMVLLLAVLAMPLMLRFFAWSGVQVAGERGGGAAMLGAVGAMSLSGAAGRAAAVTQAGFMDSSGPGSAGGASGPGGAAAGVAGAALAAASGGAGALVSGLGAVLSRAGSATAPAARRRKQAEGAGAGGGGGSPAGAVGTAGRGVGGVIAAGAAAAEAASAAGGAMTGPPPEDPPASPAGEPPPGGPSGGEPS